MGEVDEFIEDIATELDLMERLLEEGKPLQCPMFLLCAIGQGNLKVQEVREPAS